VLAVAAAIVVAPETTRSRFFGLTAPSRTASPNALTGVTCSTARIHEGVDGSASPRGRPRQVRTASASSSTPTTRCSTADQVGTSSSEPTAGPASSTTRVPSAPIPTTQPSRNARAAARARGVSSISTTATTGMGLMSTPTAIGKDCPTA
jgi:hypothetical protein